MKFIIQFLDFIDSQGVKFKNSLTYFFFSKSKLTKFSIVYLFLIILGYLLLYTTNLTNKWVFIVCIPFILYFILELKKNLRERAFKQIKISEEKDFEIINNLRGFNLNLSDGRMKAIYRQLNKYEILDEKNSVNTEQNFINVFKRPFKSNNSTLYFLISVAEVRYFIDMMLNFDSKNKKGITYKEIGFSEKFFNSQGLINNDSLVKNYSKYKTKISEEFKNKIDIILQ